MTTPASPMLPLSAEEFADRRGRIALTSFACDLEFEKRYVATIDTLTTSLAAANKRAFSDRELLAAWMIQNSYATGHGETIEDLIVELREQHKERATKSEENVLCLSGGLVAISSAKETVSAQVLRSIAYDVVFNFITPDVAKHQIEVRATKAESDLSAARARLETLERLDREAATHVESVICMRTKFTGDEPYVGWKGLGLALTEALDERDKLRDLTAAGVKGND